MGLNGGMGIVLTKHNSFGMFGVGETKNLLLFLSTYFHKEAYNLLTNLWLVVPHFQRNISNPNQSKLQAPRGESLDPQEGGPFPW